MTIQNKPHKFDTFQTVHDDALDTIEQFLNNTTDSPPMNELVRWMLETDANPYGYLPHGWAGSVSTATGFQSLLHNLHHALYDDGDVTFVTVDDQPRIVFAHQYDDGFRERVLSKQEQDLEKERFDNTPYDIKILNIKPNEFGPLHDAYQAAWLKQCFLHDSRCDIEHATEHYRKYQQWSESWVEEARKLYKGKK